MFESAEIASLGNLKYCVSLKDSNFSSDIEINVPRGITQTYMVSVIYSIIIEYSKRKMPVSPNIALAYRKAFNNRKVVSDAEIDQIIRIYLHSDSRTVNKIYPELDYNKYYNCVTNKFRYFMQRKY